MRVGPSLKINSDQAHAGQRPRLDVVHTAGQRKKPFERIGNARLDLLRRHPGIKRRHHHYRNIDWRKQVHWHSNQGDRAHNGISLPPRLSKSISVSMVRVCISSESANLDTLQVMSEFTACTLTFTGSPKRICAAIDSGIGSTNLNLEISAIRTIGIACELDEVPAATSDPVSACRAVTTPSNGATIRV